MDKPANDGSMKKRLKLYGIALAILLILIAIAIPNFLGFACKAKKYEAKQSLTGIFNKQQEYFSKNAKYADTFEKLQWHPKGDVAESIFRYAFFLSAKEAIQPDASPIWVEDKDGGKCEGNCTCGKWITPKENYSLPTGIRAFVRDKHFQIIAIGNTSVRHPLDVWSINEKGELKNIIDGCAK